MDQEPTIRRQLARLAPIGILLLVAGCLALPNAISPPAEGVADSSAPIRLMTMAQVRRSAATDGAGVELEIDAFLFDRRFVSAPSDARFTFFLYIDSAEHHEGIEADARFDVSGPEMEDARGERRIGVGYRFRFPLPSEVAPGERLLFVTIYEAADGTRLVSRNTIVNDPTVTHLRRTTSPIVKKASEPKSDEAGKATAPAGPAIASVAVKEPIPAPAPP